MASLASSCRPTSYQRLKQEVVFEDLNETRVVGGGGWRSPRKWLINRLKKVHFRRKIRVKIPRFRKYFFRIRRRTKVPRLNMISWAKVCKRLKESQSHLGELFAGNYLFMQVTPGSFNNKNIHTITPSGKACYLSHQISTGGHQISRVY